MISMSCVDARVLVRARMSHSSDSPSLFIRCRYRLHRRRRRRQFHINFDML